MSINGNQKGKAGEREWRDQLREAGFMKSYRGQQYQGGTDSPDVVCPELPAIHFEVKRVERLNIENAMAQAISDAKGKIPIVAHRKNNCDWLVTLPAEEFFKILKESTYVDSESYPEIPKAK